MVRPKPDQPDRLLWSWRFIRYNRLSEFHSVLVTTIVHVSHRHTVAVVKEAHAKVHELKSDFRQLLMVLKNRCSICGIMTENGTPC